MMSEDLSMNPKFNAVLFDFVDSFLENNKWITKSDSGANFISRARFNALKSDLIQIWGGKIGCRIRFSYIFEFSYFFPS